MKKFEEMIEYIDDRVDRSFGSAFSAIAKHFAMFSSIILVTLLALFVFKIVYQRSYYLSTVIEQDVTRIAKVLARVDKECSILKIKSGRTAINFLNVKDFVGPCVGGMHLAYPKKWSGPYLSVNPTYQQQFYELVQTYEGLFIIPGYGIKLPNGLVMGKDVVINFDTSLLKMLAVGGVLNDGKGVFGLQLNSRAGIWDPKINPPKESLDKVNNLLKEFNQAMPFTKNQEQIIQS